MDKTIKMDKKESKLPASTEIMPLKDFHIVHNKYDIKIVKGVKLMVPNLFIQNLITEKVILKKGS